MAYLNNTKSAAFKEEERALERIAEMIKSDCEDCNSSLSHSRESLSNFGYVNEYSDRVARQEMLEDIHSLQAKKNELYDILNSPYFGRIDFECADKEDLTFYVGKQGYGHGSERIILDWRSKVGGYYYDGQLSNIEFDGATYSMLLKRAIQIEQSKLISVRTVYDAYDTDSEKGIIDPFLIQLLKKRRSQKKISDIIRSIQNNQNQIIREELRTNLIVQGCAGSGKTMILLHRLSYLIFNNPAWNLDNVLIITPNETFADHISDLASDLGVGKIQRKSVEQFYCWLMDRMRLKASNIFKNRSLLSERELPRDVLKRIYAEDVADELESLLNRVVQETVNEFIETGFDSVYDRIVSERWTARDNRAIQDTYFDMKQAIGEIESKSEEYKKLKETKVAVQKQTKKIWTGNLSERSKISDVIKRLSPDTEALCLKLEEQTVLLNSKFYDEMAQLKSRMDSLYQEAGELLQKNDSLKAYIRAISTLIFDNIESEYSPEVSTLVTPIREKTAAFISQYKELENRRKQFAFFRIVSKMYIQIRQVEIKNKINAIISVEKERALRELNGLLVNAKASLSRCSAEIELCKNKVADLEKKINENNGVIRKCEQAILYLREEKWNQVKSLEISELNNYKELNDQLEGFSKVDSEVKANKELLVTLEDEIIELNRKILTEHDKEVLALARNRAEKLSFDSINGLFEVWLYRKYGEFIPIKKSCYRHQHFYQVMLLYFYYGISLPALFLNIDEAQDISLAEYNFLFRLFGEKATFNIYGDIKQIINPEKGLNSWEQLTSKRKAKEYCLKENYRNTIQITNDVNRRIGLNMLPIGIDGDEVQTVQEWPDAMSAIFKADKELRRAVIYSHELPEMIRNSVLKHSDAVVDKVDESKISVINVEMSKGLEFDFVVVLSKNMSQNESYIAYTRAMEKLIIAC